MIVYIKNSIKWDIDDYIKEIFDEFSISYKNNIIIPQKIVLNEQDVNILFSEVFMDDVKIKYGFYGGEGCDFSITISKN
jgi:hypothetical protein